MRWLPTQYHVRDSPGNASNRLSWLLIFPVLGFAGFLGWMWWSQEKPQKTQLLHPPKQTSIPNQTHSPSPPPPPVSRRSGIPAPLRTLTPPLIACPKPDVLAVQIALDRLGYSSGSIDGRPGFQTRSALRAFQLQAGLPATGELDTATEMHLPLNDAAFATWTVTSNNLARLQPMTKTWLEKSRQSALDYETILELVAEENHAHPALIRRLNPGVTWSNIPAGTLLQAPKVTRPDPVEKAAFVEIRLSDKTLEAFGTETNLLAHFPCSIAQRVEKRPEGQLHVAAVAPHPNYTFAPDLFPESPEARQLKTKLVLPAGPNNPVGTVWIGLDRPGYGIHGTPRPEDVGRTESHGCFRLANWNVEYLLKLVWVGMPVRVLP